MEIEAMGSCTCDDDMCLRLRIGVGGDVAVTLEVAGVTLVGVIGVIGFVIEILVGTVGMVGMVVARASEITLLGGRGVSLAGVGIDGILV